MKCKIEINVTGQKLEIICLLSNTKDFTLRMPKVDIHMPLLLIEVKDLKDFFLTYCLLYIVEGWAPEGGIIPQRVSTPLQT